MAENALKEEEFVFPEGGIGDFYMEDDEIEALGRLEAEEAYGSSGIANFPDIAERMASYGRHGDDTVAHVETGELVIPKALIEDNPRLRDSIFSHLKELGVEDPERYVVGSGSNSINPDTGLPEFFFKNVFRSIKKAVKKVTKAVKKVVKSVVKVVKKVAPVVLPIALSFTPLGPIYGAALGSGIGTLIKGGDLKDAFKSALIAGGTGALFSGFTGSGSFGENVSQAFADPAGRLGQTLAGAKSTFTGQGLTGEGNLFSKYVPTAEGVTSSETLADLKTDAGLKQNVSGTETIQDLTGQGDAFQMAKDMNLPYDPATNTYQYTTDAGTVAIGPKTTVAQMNTQLNALKPVQEPSFFENLSQKAETAGDYLFRGGQSKKDLATAASNASKEATQNYLKDAAAAGLDTSSAAVQSAAIEAGKAAAAATAPGLLTTFGPSAALAGAGLYAAGAFTPPPQEDVNIEDIQGPTGEDLIAQNPDDYLVGGNRIVGADGTYSVASNYAYNPYLQLQQNPFGNLTYAAKGGEIFPRRTGGIMPDEGIPNQDSVRAMLMPGEFVMTTDAVRGLGNGNLNRGIDNMYGMMRNLEARGRGMA